MFVKNNIIVFMSLCFRPAPLFEDAACGAGLVRVRVR